MQNKNVNNIYIISHPTTKYLYPLHKTPQSLYTLLQPPTISLALTPLYTLYPVSHPTSKSLHFLWSHPKISTHPSIPNPIPTPTPTVWDPIPQGGHVMHSNYYVTVRIRGHWGQTVTTTPSHQHHHNNTITTTPSQQHRHINTVTTTPSQQHRHITVINESMNWWIYGFLCVTLYNIIIHQWNNCSGDIFSIKQTTTVFLCLISKWIYESCISVLKISWCYC